MSGEFLGTFENSLNKNRVVIPAPFKKKLSKEANDTVIVTMGPKTRCILVYPIDVWNLIKEKFNTGSEEQKLLLILMRNRAVEEVLEGPGRIKIPQTLLDVVGISDKVVFLGEGEYMSIWNPEVWEKKNSEELEQFNKYDTIDFGLWNGTTSQSS